MGCRQSSSKVPKQVTAVEVDGLENRNGNAPANHVTPASKTCEKLGVTDKQIFCLRQSWKGIRRNMEDAGIEMFVR